MSSRTDVLLWARRVTGLKKSTPHQLLEIAPDAGLDAAQEAFHKIAKMAHPDLHRTGHDPDELEGERLRRRERGQRLLHGLRDRECNCSAHPRYLRELSIT